MEPIDMLPLLMPVAWRTRVPIFIALSNNVLRLSPDAFSPFAVLIDSFTWPSICSSPITRESRPDVSLSR